MKALPAGTLPGMTSWKVKLTTSSGPTTRLPKSSLKERAAVIGTGGTVVQFGGSQPATGPPTSGRHGLPDVE